MRIREPLVDTSFEQATARATLDLGFTGRRLLKPLKPLGPGDRGDFGGLTENRTAVMTTRQR